MCDMRIQLATFKFGESIFFFFNFPLEKQIHTRKKKCSSNTKANHKL